MTMLRNKRVLLGICGGIAAYKSADLTRKLVDAGAEVRVVMTRAAQEFITPLTLHSLSGHPVSTDLFESETASSMGHIELARWADLIIIAPATADVIARLAHGLADDLLTTLCLASRAPLLLAPAMNHVMWEAAATRDNISLLSRRGVRFSGPEAGFQACGESGEGRMREPMDILEDALQLFASDLLAGCSVLVTAGPTREALDPVRFLANRSSGKMGFAIAQAARDAGARTTLISGPVALQTPDGVNRIDITSAEEMKQAVMSQTGDTDIFISAAAVADYRPKAMQQDKIKKAGDELHLSLEKTPDILSLVAAIEHGPFTVGFAAETNELEHYAKSKLSNKKLDMIAANPVAVDGPGIEADDNRLTVFWPGHQVELDLMPKTDLARELIRIISSRFQAKNHG